jgi:hypothetical protein
MNAVDDLAVLRNSLLRRCTLLRQLILTFEPPLNAEADRLVSFVVIESMNAWASFSRAFYLSCSVRDAYRTNGIRVTGAGVKFPNSADAIYRAAMIAKGAKRPPRGRREEPTWDQPSTLLKTFHALRISNLSQVQAALSHPTNVFDYLPAVRNFFAHRNDETMNRVRDLARRLGVNPSQKACEIVCCALRGRPQNILADWLDDLRIVGVLLCG